MNIVAYAILMVLIFTTKIEFTFEHNPNVDHIIKSNFGARQSLIQYSKLDSVIGPRVGDVYVRQSI